MDKSDFSSDGVILLLGVTGAGKSYFLNKLKSHSAKEGHGLQSETARCQAVRIVLKDDGTEDTRSIVVVDTPGFDDTKRNRGEILKEITEYLATQYALGVPLRGVIYLHKITDNRMTGSSVNYLKILRSLVGDDALGNLILVTNMWNKLRDEDRGEALQREQELIDDFWDPMIEKGSYVHQFDGTTESAFGLVHQLADKKSVVLAIQKQIMDEDQYVLDTSAGENLAQQLKIDISGYRTKAAQLEAQLEAQPDGTQRKELKEEREQMEELLEQAEESMESMKVRPGPSIRERIKQVLKDSGKDIGVALAAALSVTVSVIRLVIGA
ncbi:hypothetical protein NW757_004463 [Fusarium falciforme]|nr:hypothetical protein NW757_004463 [Fusarium falciforme]